MRVQLVVAAAQPLVRAVQVEGASVEDAVAQLGAWDAAGLRVPAVILPVEPRELAGIAGSLKAGAAAVAAGRLVLAVPEAGVATARRPLDELRTKAGVLAAVTGVGADANPDADFDWLIDYPADLVVLASRLSYSAVLNEGAGEVLGDVCGIAHELGWITVAEGIRDGEQRTALAAIGVDQVFGPIAGEPCPAEELAALLDAQGVALDPRPLAQRGARPGARAARAPVKAPTVVPAAAVTSAAVATATVGKPEAKTEAEPEPEPETAAPAAPAPAAPAPAPVAPAAATATATVSEAPAGGWASHQGRQRRFRSRRVTAPKASSKAGASTVAAAAAARYSARPAGSGNRMQDTPSPSPYSGIAASRWLPILLLFGVAAVIVAVVLL